jgi:hypothetical protein
LYFINKGEVEVKLKIYQYENMTNYKKQIKSKIDETMFGDNLSAIKVEGDGDEKEQELKVDEKGSVSISDRDQ